MNKDTRGTIDIQKVKDRRGTIVQRETYVLACQFYCTEESCIFMGEVKAKLDRGAIV